MTMSPPTDNRLDTRFLAGSPPAASTLASVPQIGLQSCHQSARAKSRPPRSPLHARPCFRLNRAARLIRSNLLKQKAAA